MLVVESDVPPAPVTDPTLAPVAPEPEAGPLPLTDPELDELLEDPGALASATTFAFSLAEHAVKATKLPIKRLRVIWHCPSHLLSIDAPHGSFQAQR